MKREYEISTLQDMLAVPPERRAAMLHELEFGLLSYEFAFGENAEKAPFTFIWIDDGHNSVTMYDQTGQEFLKLEATG